MARCRFYGGYLLALTLIGACGGPAMAGSLAEAISTAYAANRSSITYGNFRFRYDVGRAADLESAARGDWSRRASARGGYAFDGVNAVYERVFSAAGMAADRVPTGVNQWSSQLDSKRRLTNGKVTLWDNLIADDRGTSHLHTAQIDPGVEIFHRGMLFPLDLGSPRRERRGLRPRGKGANRD